MSFADYEDVSKGFVHLRVCSATLVVFGFRFKKTNDKFPKGNFLIF